MTFTDGQRAIDTLKNRLTNLPIDLIITDWNMLEATGLQILEYVWGEGSVKETPFIMKTQRNSLEDLQNVKKLKIDHYLIKPFSFNDLSDRISLIFSKP